MVLKNPWPSWLCCWVAFSSDFMGFSGIWLNKRSMLRLWLFDLQSAVPGGDSLLLFKETLIPFWNRFSWSNDGLWYIRLTCRREMRIGSIGCADSIMESSSILSAVLSIWRLAIRFRVVLVLTLEVSGWYMHIFFMSLTCYFWFFSISLIL